jgi:rare lipoprotein A
VCWLPSAALWSAGLFLLLCIAVTGCARRPTTAGIPGNPPAGTPEPPVPSQPTAPSEPGAPPPALPPGAPQPFAPGVYVEEGVASWYGVPFHGRTASNGEIYDMNKPTAAHRTLPFGSIVRVTNLTNGQQTEVRITDRGPFIGGRVIDLSFAAARSINMVGPGIAKVRLELVSVPAPLTGDFTVQIGAYRDRATADQVRAKFVGRYPVFVQEVNTPKGHFFRVRVGRVASQQDAQKLAAQLRSEGSAQTFIVRLDMDGNGTR